MLARLVERLRPGRAPRIPPGEIVYAIGDVHGRADLLARLHERVREDAAEREGPAYLVHLGDYVDRGPDSAGVIDLVIGARWPGFAQIRLRGNHEEMMLAFLVDLEAGYGWLANGGEATLASYGIARAEAMGETTWLRHAQASLRRSLPPAHRAFLESLELCWACGDYAFVHAGIRPGIALEDQSREDLLWIRDAFLDSRRDHGRVVVHGHSIAPALDERPNRIGIDTGAVVTGTLTCLVLEDDRRRVLQT